MLKQKRNRNGLIYHYIFRFLLIIPLVITCFAWAEEPALQQVVPIDEGLRDDSFLSFRDQLLQVIRFREPERLVRLIDHRVINGVQTESGIQAFAKLWRVDATDSPIWDTLEEILNLGGGYIRSSLGVKFCAPYVFTHFPPTINPANHVVVLAEDVEIVTEPKQSSAMVRTVSHAILKVENFEEVQDEEDGVLWMKIRLPNGVKGFIDASKVRSPADYHACFLLNKDTWKLFSLVKH